MDAYRFDAFTKAVGGAGLRQSLAGRFVEDRLSSPVALPLNGLGTGVSELKECQAACREQCKISLGPISIMNISCMKTCMQVCRSCPGMTVCQKDRLLPHVSGFVCADLQSDPKHCGDCSVECGSGERCMDAVCTSICQPWESECRGLWGPTQCCQPDEFCMPNPLTLTARCDKICGDCERYDGVKCVSACGSPCLKCKDSQCVPVSGVECGQECCEPPSVCVGGRWCMCPFSCEPGRVPNEECTSCVCDLTLCRPDQVYNPVTCQCECAPGHSDCNGSCADLSNDPAYCGQCGEWCGANNLCVEGVCSQCPPWTKACPGANNSVGCCSDANGICTTTASGSPACCSPGKHTCVCGSTLPRACCANDPPC